MNWLNYHHLMYFRTIATEGSISKASKKLNVGQSALSVQLKQLENSFNLKLFERRNRQLFLTEAGKSALKYANQIHSLGNELIEVLHNKEHSTQQHLSIGSLDSVPKNLVVKVIENCQKYQNCHITSLDGTGEDLYRQLMAHTLDVVISNHHIVSSTDKSVYTKSIGKYKLGIYASQKYAALTAGFPKSLANQPLILPTTHSKLRHDVEHYFESHKIPVKVIADTQDTTVQKLLALDGQGLIAEPEFAVKSLLREKKLIRVGNLKGVYEEFFLTSTKRVIENKIANHLMKNFEFNRPASEKYIP